MTTDLWAPSGMYDRSTVTLGDRTRCFVGGHDVRSWGTEFGWCHRCKHTVHNYGGRRRVLYYGEYYWFPPAHQHQNEAVGTSTTSTLRTRT